MSTIQVVTNRRNWRSKKKWTEHDQVLRQLFGTSAMGHKSFMDEILYRLYVTYTVNNLSHVGESPTSSLTPLAHEGQGAGLVSALVHLSAKHLASMRMEGVQQMRYVNWKK